MDFHCFSRCAIAFLRLVTAFMSFPYFTMFTAFADTRGLLLMFVIVLPFTAFCGLSPHLCLLCLPHCSHLLQLSMCALLFTAFCGFALLLLFFYDFTYVIPFEILHLLHISQFSKQMWCIIDSRGSPWLFAVAHRFLRLVSPCASFRYISAFADSLSPSRLLVAFRGSSSFLMTFHCFLMFCSFYISMTSCGFQ